MFTFEIHLSMYDFWLYVSYRLSCSKQCLKITLSCQMENLRCNMIYFVFPTRELMLKLLTRIALVLEENVCICTSWMLLHIQITKFDPISPELHQHLWQWCNNSLYLLSSKRKLVKLFTKFMPLHLHWLLKKNTYCILVENR